MSPRITRSAARLAARQVTDQATNPDDNPEVDEPTIHRNKNTKRKARTSDISPAGEGLLSSSSSRPKSKRQRLQEQIEDETTLLDEIPSQKGKSWAGRTNMSTSGPSNGEEEEISTPVSSASRKKQGKGKKSMQDSVPATPPAPSRRPKKASKKSDENIMQEEHSAKRSAPKPSKARGSREPKTQAQPPPPETFDEDVDMDEDVDPREADPPFSKSSFLGRGGQSSLSQARAFLGGLMPQPGTATKLRGLLQNLKCHEDPTIQAIAMEELSELLLVSNEDNLNGQFVPDHFVKELVLIMRGGEFGGSSPEMMELACRCIANLLEALPQATHSVVANGVISVLCEKLTNMEYMEQAEQAMTTLSKISDEFPGAIVREGGLLACLMHLDFFTTYMQKTAVSTAAKCCLDLSENSIDAVLEVMPTLHGVLNNSEQEVVKQAALCITRIVDRFGYHERLEQIVTPDLLKTVFRLLLPASTNIVGDDVQTKFLMLLSTVARGSPNLTAELLKNDVVDIIYQFLTGVSPPEGDEDSSVKIDGVLVMQALIHKPRDQVFRALNVICQILPDTPGQESQAGGRSSIPGSYPGELQTLSKSRASRNAERLKAFESCKEKVRRFVMILLPTLTHAYDITVNLGVRSTVLDAQLKMLSNIDANILESALRTVPFASFLASILSQEDHSTLVLQALQATELLLTRLKPIYAYQFCREGVLAELKRLSDQKLSEKPKDKPQVLTVPARHVPSSSIPQGDGADDEDDEADRHEEDYREADDEDDEDGDGEIRQFVDPDMDHEHRYAEDSLGSPSSSEDEAPAYRYPGEDTKDEIILKARKILELFDDGQGREIRKQAETVLAQGRSLAAELQEYYHQGSYEQNAEEAQRLFEVLAKYFSTDALRTITSAELLNSNIIEVLLDVMDIKHDSSAEHARKSFVEAFTKAQSPADETNPTAFNVLVHKLQDLLSRKEHFEVVTIHNNSQENSRMDKDNLSYQLGKQIRLKLEGSDAASGIPPRYRNMVVSIHAIATFKSLNDYLRPRMLITSENLSRGDVLSTLAALTGSDMPHRQRLLDMEKALERSRAQASALTAATTATSASRNASRQASTKSLRETAATNQAAQSAPQTPIGKPKLTARKSSRSTKNEKADQESASIEDNTAANPQEHLECADEHNLEEDDDDVDDDQELNAVIEDLEDELDDEAMPDPAAVNLEVASTGKVTATKDDGTRVATPSQNTPSGLGMTLDQARAALRNTGSPRGSSGARSYAAAVQSTPQDWHLEFSIDGKRVDLDTTVYRAVHLNQINPTDPNGRPVFNNTHVVKFKKVSGPPPAHNSLTGNKGDVDDNELPESVHKNTVTSKILRLLGCLHDINSNLSNLLGDVVESHSRVEPASQFVNTKLTAKLNRQLEEPLIVASGCLPQWSEDLVRLYPFLFPFEARYLYLQSNYFGYQRAIERWSHLQTDDSRNRRRDDRPYLAMPKKQKVRIARERLFDSAVKVLDLYASSSASLEVEYFDEVGTGLGPTMEFYSNVSREFAKKRHNLWRQSESTDNSEYTYSKLGLFPAPMSENKANSEEGKKVLALFKALGKFVARSMIDSRMIDVSFNPMFFKCGDAEKSSIPQLALVKLIDQDLANSLKHIQNIITRKNSHGARRFSTQQKTLILAKTNIEIEALGLDMTLPGYPEIELVANGRNIDVTADNIEEYLAKVINYTVDKGITRQIQEFRKGFSDVYPYKALRAFTADELVMIFGSSVEDWSIPTLIDSIKADHGFHIDSMPVRNLLQIMSELDEPRRRLFLQFVTGSPKLPIGGFKKLMPAFTVVLRKDDSGSGPDEFLPSVMTCTNYLKLPDYSTLEIMRGRIQQAINEGQGAFHLS